MTKSPSTTESPVSIGWVGDVHSGTLTCNVCGWEKFTKSWLADDWEMQHRADHGEEKNPVNTLDALIAAMTISLSPARGTRTLDDAAVRAVVLNHPLLMLRVLHSAHPDTVRDWA